MSKKSKPEFQGPPTQSRALQMFAPQGFYAPTGSLSYNTGTANGMGGATGGGYQVNLQDSYNPLNTLPQYNDIRTRLLGDLGIVGADRAKQLDEYGNAFMNKSLEYSAPRLQALTYGRGQAGSRMAGDAYSDLINKASTDAVLNRDQLRQLDEQMKINQLNTIENGANNAYNNYGNIVQQLMAGAGLSNGAAGSALDQANQYVNAQNALEAERYQRAQQSNGAGNIGSLIGTGLAVGAAPFTGGASLAYAPMMAGAGGQIGGLFDPSTSANGNMSNSLGLANLLSLLRNNGTSSPGFGGGQFSWLPSGSVPGAMSGFNSAMNFMPKGAF